ncbi:putative C-mannosyltransferase DPY19L1 [Astyanax mexicanus]|uniref:Putative C-mannosyltransferase DPY19L1 n=1 Tax=Astyanax mexicanus TaxID=7994 RepID=A0A8T2KJK0_ASTMX|nr:putative C-mannosyltransferase DPY19L1 [Astyanax mexicanus]KAG9283898.1 putative C-mannosyltransferase DPY19L1 [Astyanax mexicanus]
MAVKSKKQAGREQLQAGADRERSPAAPGRGRRARESRAPPQGSQTPGRAGSFTALLRTRLGLGPAASARLITVLIIAAFAGALHWYHLFHLFENDRHFSHMSGLEKEMAFRTEMGLYYSYFKTVIEAPSFLNGLHLIMNDRLTEYPLIINTLKRFNLYPEVVLASWYRIYTTVMGYFKIPTKMCWSINRGEGLEPVDSCEGMGDPAYFYVTFVFLLNGVMMSLFYIYGTYLSGSHAGGVITVSSFFFNHGESTRVMWTPPLRESFSYPFLVLQMLLLTYILRSRKPSRNAVLALCVSNVMFMLPWQFAQFVLLTQVASLFATYILGYLSPDKMQTVLITHMVSLGVCFVLMFGNSMLLTSFYASSLISIWGVIYLRERFITSFGSGLLTWVMQCVAWVITTVILKLLLALVLGASDDAHISSLIKSKFTSYKDFDTMMYTCAAEFDFMEAETVWRYMKTLLLPVNVLVVAVVAVRTVKDIITFLKNPNNKTPEPENEHSSDQVDKLVKGVVVYHSLQLVAFAVLAVLIMRLKLFLTPHMCLMAALLSSRQMFGWVGEKMKQYIIVFGILSIMTVQGVANLQNQWGIIGEFSNLPQEDLLEWIKENTPQSAVFAGAMPTMASVKLSAGRAIVNHPHYEDAGLRERTKLVYAMYSRKPVEEVKRNLVKLQVDFFILEDSWCTRRSRPGCSMPEIWDVEDPGNAGKIPLCTLMSRETRPHFTTVFHNSVYKVLKVPRATGRTR